MITTRLDRRIAILRGKRAGAFDRDQYYLEQAQRARVARKLRCYLRDMRPVVLITPRWSGARTFLDDVAVDLSVGQPYVRCRTLSMRPLDGKTPHQTWTWLVQAITEFCGLSLGPQAQQVVSREGFRRTLGHQFERAEEQGPRCLMIHALECLHVEALHDLVTVVEDHVHHRTRPAAFNLVLAGSLGVTQIEVRGVERLWLADHDRGEAVEALVEHLGPEELESIRNVASAAGGVPEMLAALATLSAEGVRRASVDRRALWQALGPLGAEIRRTWDIVAADPVYSARLEVLANDSAVPHVPERDGPLVEAGLVQVIGPPMPRVGSDGVTIAPWALRRSASLRSPLFADLVVR